MQRWQCPIHNSTLASERFCRVLFLLSVYYDNSNMLQLKQAIHLCREITIENNPFSKLKSLLSNCILDQTMLGCCCESGIAGLHGGSLKITLIDPLSMNDFPCDLAPMMVPQHKLEIWPGYVSRVHETDGGLMLICDTSFKVLR